MQQHRKPSYSSVFCFDIIAAIVNARIQTNSIFFNNYCRVLWWYNERSRTFLAKYRVSHKSKLLYCLHRDYQSILINITDRRSPVFTYLFTAPVSNHYTVLYHLSHHRHSYFSTLHCWYPLRTHLYVQLYIILSKWFVFSNTFDIKPVLTGYLLCWKVNVHVHLQLQYLIKKVKGIKQLASIILMTFVTLLKAHATFVYFC